MSSGMRWGHRVWRGLGSIRLAAVLLAAVLLASLPGSLFPQMPADPAAREAWLAGVALRYGQATGLLRAVGLFDAGHAPWFLALLAALLLNLLICTLQRLPRLGRSCRQGHWTQAGTLLSHLAALCLGVAVAARPALVWQESGIRLLPGQVHRVGHGRDLAVQAGELAIDPYPDGQPRDYRVPLTVLAGGSPLKSRTVRLNHPLTWQGVSFHLQGYGPAARVVAPEGTFALDFAGSQSQEIRLPQAGLTLRLALQPGTDRLFVEARTPEGLPLGSGTVADGQPIAVQGTPLTFYLSHYTIWQVSHDPTFGPTGGSAGLLLVAAMISLWTRPARGPNSVEGSAGEADE